MRHLKSFAIAFSMYSKIPVPIFPWKDEDMKYVMAYFPLVGAVIGLAEILWNRVSTWFCVGNLLYTAAAFVIPILISGGIHLDGFIDTQDALHSYQSREKKIEILKDPNTGAFALISLMVWAVLSFAGWGEIISEQGVVLAGLGFWLARIYSGISVVLFPSMKNKGTVVGFHDTAQKKSVMIILLVQMAVVAGLSFYYFGRYSVIWNAAELCVFLWYYYKSKKEFGGINGDLAGWFVTISECVCVLTAALLQ